MSETINGSLSVSNDVIADIAGYAAMTCYGVVGMAEQLQGAESLRVGIEVVGFHAAASFLVMMIPSFLASHSIPSSFTITTE